MSTPTQDLANTHILVVDNEKDLEPVIRQHMQQEISDRRYSFEFVNSGLAALDRLRANERFDIILTDVDVSVMGGANLLEEIPKIAAKITASLVIAENDMQNIHTAMRHGAFSFIPKPLDITDLKVTIERAVDNLGQLREVKSLRSRLHTLEHELHMAQTLQERILPTTFPKTKDYDIYADMVAAHSVGGDFYDVFDLDRGHVGVLIADVSDKGIPAAMFMMASRTLLKACAACSVSPSQVLGQVNYLLSQDNEAMNFVTLFYGIYDPETGKLKYTNAGHNCPVLIQPGKEPELLYPTSDIALGVAEDFQFSEKTVTLPPGSIVVLYTDGVSEAERQDNRMFGMGRLMRVFQEKEVTDNAKVATEAVFQAVEDFTEGNEQSDDITCLVLRTCKPSPHVVLESHTLTIPNRIEEIRTVHKALQEYSKKIGMPPDKFSQIQLALEELVINIIFYAHKDKKVHQIQVNFSATENTLTIELVDDGIAFDPLSDAPKMDTEKSLEERPLGCAGIALAQQFLTSIEYRRTGKHNRLKLTYDF